MKKLFFVFFILTFILSSLTVSTVAMAEETFNSKSSILTDYNSGTVILANNENARLPIASMCKIMTLLLVFEEVENGLLSFDDQICISENASGMGGSQAFLETNAQYKVYELIKSIVVASANDSCVAFAEKICGSEKDFVLKMNEQAKKLGMKNTLFSNCTGLPKPTQYSCAKDVAIMFSSLIKHKKYFEFSNIWLDKIEHPKGRITELTNTNKLIRFYEGCDGGKTGYTAEAGYCLAATAKRGDMRLISVVISAPDSKTRFNETTTMFNYGFSNFTNKMIVDSTTPLNIKAEISGGVEKKVEIIPEKNYYYFTKKNSNEDFRLDFNPKIKISAPVKKGDILGELIVFKDNIELTRINCLAAYDIEKKPFFMYVADIMSEWCI